MQHLGHFSPLEAAREYVARGWAAIPLDGKRPLLQGWTKAELTPEDLRQHFRDDTNVGVLLGEPSRGLVDVDLDHSMALRLADRLLPPTEAVFGRPSKPGSHRLYRVRGPLPQTKRWWGLDGEGLVELRSTGTQTMFPPSTHPSGERVRWEQEGEPAEVTSEELVDACSKLAAATLLVLSWPPQGSRHHVSLALAGFLLRRGWTEEEAAQFIEVIAEAAGDEEVRNRVRNAVTTARRLLEGRPATGLPRLREFLGERVVRCLEGWAPGQDRVPNPNSYLRIGIGNAPRVALEVVRCWERSEPPPRVWHVPGLLPDGCLTLLYGDAGSYKSYLALGLAVAKASGREFLGHKLKAGAVLYLDAELDVEEFLRRAYRVARGLGLERPPEGLHYARLPESLANPGLSQALEEVVRELSPSISVLDSLTLGSQGADLEHAEDATAIMGRLLRLGTVLAVDHTPKPPPGVNLSALRPYGSFAKWALARHVVQVLRSEGTDALLLRPAKSNFGPLQPPIGVAVRFEGDLVRFEVVPVEDERLSGAEEHLPRIEQVYRLLCEVGPAKPEDLAKALDLATKSVRNYLSTLRVQKRARPLEDGRWEACRPDSHSQFLIVVGNWESDRPPEPGREDQPETGPDPAAEPPPSWALELARALPTPTGIPVERTARTLATPLEPPDPHEPDSGPGPTFGDLPRAEPHEDPPHPPTVCVHCRPAPFRGYFACVRRGRVLLRFGVDLEKHTLRRLKALGFSKELLEATAPEAIVVTLRGGRGWGWTSMARARREGIEGTFGAEPQLAVPLAAFRWTVQEDLWGTHH